jgi:hypothetical protein
MGNDESETLLEAVFICKSKSFRDGEKFFKELMNFLDQIVRK